jgi:hypothetical protein
MNLATTIAMSLERRKYLQAGGPGSGRHSGFGGLVDRMKNSFGPKPMGNYLTSKGYNKTGGNGDVSTYSHPSKGSMSVNEKAGTWEHKLGDNTVTGTLGGVKGLSSHLDWERDASDVKKDIAKNLTNWKQDASEVYKDGAKNLADWKRGASEVNRSTEKNLADWSKGR